MKSKKLISLFFFLILGVQVLPLQRIAVWLSSGQLTEEMAHGVSPVKAKSLMDEIDPACTVQSFHAGIHSLLLATLEKHHRDETLLIRHADDILTPPPNV